MTPEIKLRIEQIQNGSVPDGYKKLNVSDYCIPNEWTTISMSDLFTEFSEKNHPDSDVLTIIQGTGTVLREESGREIIYDSDSLSNYKFVKKGDFIIHLRSFEGGLEIANQDGIVSPAYIILCPKTNIASDYYYALFHSNRFINQTMAPAVEGVRDGRSVKYEVLKNQTVPFPPLPEQQKISKILFAQDKVIAFKQKLLQEKKQQKKYLMRKLLSADGASFMLDGVKIDKSGWRPVKLGKLGTFSKGAGIKREEANSGDIPAIRYGEIYTTHNEYIKSFYSFISENVAKQSKLVKEGDILFSCSGETIEDIGKCVAYIFNYPAYAGGDIIVFSPKSDCDSKFLGYLLNSNIVAKQRYRYAQGDSIVHISTESLGKISFYLPSLHEQQTIAKILSAADKEIELLQKSIEQEKQKKKALMQLLLTGIVRVKIYEC